MFLIPNKKKILGKANILKKNKAYIKLILNNDLILAKGETKNALRAFCKLRRLFCRTFGSRQRCF
jgi:hypothetical protein